MNGVFSTFSSSSTSAATAFAHSWWEWPQDDLGLEEKSTGHQQSCVEMISASGEVPGAWHPSLHSQFWDPRHHLSAPWAPCVTCPCTLNHSIAQGIEFKLCKVSTPICLSRFWGVLLCLTLISVGQLSWSTLGTGLMVVCEERSGGVKPDSPHNTQKAKH